MSRMTPKMVLDEKVSLGNNCHAFWGCNEGSGTQIVDVMQGLIVADAGMTWPHGSAATLGISGYTNAANNNILDLSNKYLLFVHAFDVNTSAAFGVFGVSENAAGNKPAFSMGPGAGFSYDDTVEPATSVTSSLAAVSSGDVIQAGTFDPLSGTIELLEAQNGAALVSQGTAVVPEHRRAQSLNISTPEIILNSNGFDQDTYAAAIFAWDKGFPNDLSDALAFFSEMWRLGKKFGWQPWVG